MPLPFFLPKIAMFAPAALNPTSIYYLRLATTAASSLSSLSLAAFLVREAWKRLPQWVKDDELFRSLRIGSGGGPDEDDGYVSSDDKRRRSRRRQRDPDEMASIRSLFDKLNALIEDGNRKLASQGRNVAMSSQQLHAAILASVQLAWQFRRNYPDLRDDLYALTRPDDSDDEPGVRDGSFDDYRRRHEPVTASDLEGLERALEFAIWAYEENSEDLAASLGDIGFELIQNKVSNKPGHVGHFIAVSDNSEDDDDDSNDTQQQQQKQRLMVIGVKGTSSLEDLLTDCCGRVVTYSLTEQCPDHCPHAETLAVEVHPTPILYASSSDSSSSQTSHPSLSNKITISSSQRTMRCHEGVLISAKRLADDLDPFVRGAINRNTTIRLCGHSLGGGAAALLGTILRQRYPSLRDENRLTVVAFAPPPVMDHESAVGCRSFVTSVVNNSDVIPRSSMGNVGLFLEFLKFVHERLEERGLSPVSMGSSVRFLKMLSRGAKGDMLMTVEEVKKAMRVAHRRVKVRDPDHVYVPGKVILLSERWNRVLEDEEGRDDHDDDDCDRDDMVLVNTRDEKDVSAVVTCGTTKVLRLFDFDLSRMCTDHLTSSYEVGIRELINKYGTDSTSNRRQNLCDRGIDSTCFDDDSRSCLSSISTGG